MKNDIYSLNRFIKIQDEYFEKVSRELKKGKKESHWMWFMFPQIQGLGHSLMAQFYAINGKSEAKAYLENAVLRERLYKLINILLQLNINDPIEIFGYIDSMKLFSSMTLFLNISNDNIFQKVLDKFYNGFQEEKTLDLLSKA